MSVAVAQAIRGMMAAGLTLDQALLAIEKMDEAKRSSGKSNAERQAAWRARQKAVTSNESNARNVTSVMETPPYTEDARTYAEPEPTNTTNKGKNDILTDISKIPAEKPDLGFDAAWQAYPRRQGGNSRKNAEVRYRKAVKSGAEPEAILAGVRAYAEHCDATGKTGTEFVKTAEAWLNGHLWESDWSISLSRPGPPHRQAKRNTALDGLDELERRYSANVQQPSFLRIAG